MLSFAAAVAAVLSSLSAAQAQSYPTHPITLVVPFPAGGPTDTVARIMAEHMRNTLGQPILIETVTGAGATIGVSRVVNAAPDGYTLSIGNWSSHVGSPAIYPVSWNPVTDLDADRSAAGVVADDRRPGIAAGQKRQGADRLAQGQSGQGLGG